MQEPHAAADALVEALTRELARAWDALSALAPGESVYTFAVYTSDAWSYLLATGITKEALARSVPDATSEATDWAEGMTAEALFLSCCDWEFHGKLPELRESERLLESVPSDLTFEEYCRFVRSCVVQTLQGLDARGVFGKGAVRERLVLSIAMGDMSEQEWEPGLQELNPEATYEWHSRLQAIARAAAARTRGPSPNAKAAYWVAQFVECAERGIEYPSATSDGFERSDVEAVLVELGPVAVSAMVSTIERSVFEPESFRDMSERDHGPMLASAAVRAFRLVWVLRTIGEIDDVSVTSLLEVLRGLVDRDESRDWTDTSAENLARILHELRPARFPATILDPNTNHLRNPADFLA